MFPTNKSVLSGSDNNTIECGELSNRDEFTGQTVRIIIDMVVDSFKISHSEKTNVTRLLESLLWQEFTRLLEEHMQAWIESFVEDGYYIKDLDLGEVDAKESRSYRCHAKLHPLMDAIKNKYAKETK